MKPTKVTITNDVGTFSGFVQNCRHVEAVKLLRIEAKRADRGLPLLSAHEPSPGCVLMHLEEHPDTAGNLTSFPVSLVGAVIA